MYICIYIYIVYTVNVMETTLIQMFYSNKIFDLILLYTRAKGIHTTVSAQVSRKFGPQLEMILVYR